METTILNVDDNSALRYLRGQTLRQAGYKVIEASNGAEALSLAKERHADLVLLDVNLPDISGLEVCKAIKSNPDTAAVPVLHISATAVEKHDLITGLQAADAYLVEPVLPDVLLAFVRALLRGRELLQQWVSIFDALADGVALLNSEGRILRCNSAFCRLTRKRLSEVLGHLITGVVADAGCNPSEFPFPRSLRTRQSETVECSLGDRIYRLSSHLALVDGNVAGAVYIISDITAEKQAAREKGDAFALLHALTDGAPVGFAFFNREMRYQLVNKELAEINGMAVEDHLGRTVEEVVPSVAVEARAVFQSVMETAQPVLDHEFIGETAKAPGEVRSWSENWYPVHSPDGHLLGVGVTVVETTERKRLETAFRENEARFRRLVESNIIGIATADRNGLKTANDLYLRMIGGTREDLEANRIDWLVATPPEHVGKDLRAFEELRTRGSSTPFEKEFVRADGTRVPVLSGAAALKSEPLEWISFVIDLTQQKALESKLLDAQKLESIGLLAGGIAHDFNNLLTVILGNASLAQELVPSGTVLGKCIEDIVEASERAAHLTKQMLAYAGKGRFVIEAIDLSQEAREVAQLASPSISKKITLHLNLPKDLPAVHADRGQVHQIVMNLVVNAAEAIGDEPGLISVRTGVQHVDPVAIPPGADLQPGACVYLEVRDTGCGMDDSTKAKIFDPFFTTKFTGRGLGLAAVAGIVRGHKGAVQVSSSPGQGSVFSVLFPAAAEPVTVPPEVSVPATVEAGDGGTVLLVDDEEVVLRTAKAGLERRGYTVLLAESGPAAIELFAREAANISVIILDLSMPGMSGHEALPYLRKIRPDVRVLISSGYSEAETMRWFSGQQIVGFLQKPYNVLRLTEKVKTALAASVDQSSANAQNA